LLPENPVLSFFMYKCNSVVGVHRSRKLVSGVRWRGLKRTILLIFSVVAMTTSLPKNQQRTAVIYFLVQGGNLPAQACKQRTAQHFYNPSNPQYRKVAEHQLPVPCRDLHGRCAATKLQQHFGVRRAVGRRTYSSTRCQKHQLDCKSARNSPLLLRPGCLNLGYFLICICFSSCCSVR